MNRPARSIEIFTMSALDLFITAMGSFAILMMILFPYYNREKKPHPNAEAVAKSHVLFCVWDTRVKDYEQFVKETGYVGSDVLDKDKAAGTTAPPPAEGRGEAAWKNPGYEQKPEFPVVGVSWSDANAFCKWLTEKERKTGAIGPEDEYRLPTDAEWMAAAGPNPNPWGDKPENIPKVANFAGAEYDEGTGTQGAIGKAGLRDNFQMVAPVGSFEANLYGLFDMGGNVWQWIEDPYRATMNTPEVLEANPALKDEKKRDGTPMRAIHGGSWNIQGGAKLLSTYRDVTPDSGWDDTGFRCVLVVKDK